MKEDGRGGGGGWIVYRPRVEETNCAGAVGP